MPRKRHNPEWIARKLRQAEVELARDPRREVANYQ